MPLDTAYAEFVISKSQIGGQHGFKPVYENPHCYDFQNFLVDWACYQGRGRLVLN